MPNVSIDDLKLMKVGKITLQHTFRTFINGFLFMYQERMLLLVDDISELLLDGDISVFQPYNKRNGRFKHLLCNLQGCNNYRMLLYSVLILNVTFTRSINAFLSRCRRT